MTAKNNQPKRGGKKKREPNQAELPFQKVVPGDNYQELNPKKAPGGNQGLRNLVMK